MRTKQKRGNDYWLQRLVKWPDIHRKCKSGAMTIAEGRRLAGLISERTRLHELKNAWTKATAIEKRDFISWLHGTGAATPAPSTGKSAFGPNGLMLAWARRRLAEVMSRRALSSGQLARELGLDPRNTSVMTAVRRDVVLNPATASAVDHWIIANGGV